MSGIERIPHDGRIAEIRLARAPVNALDPDLCLALDAALRGAIDGHVQAILLSGGPKVFSAGLDVPRLLALGDDRDALLQAWQGFFSVARTLAASPVPVAAALAGHAPAGGCVLALCCDYRVMARSPNPAKPFMIGMNETQVGLAVPEGAQQLMRRVIGPYRAERLLVSGSMVTADEALRLGLVDTVVEVDQVVPHALEWLGSLLALPRTPMLLTRSLARADLVRALQPENLDLERFVEGWYDADTQAGLRALLARLGK